MSDRVRKVMTQPINLIFRFLQNQQRISIWLFNQSNLRIEGVILGFDEYMNLTLDEAEEHDVANDTRTKIGRILLKGDNVSLMQAV